MSEIREIRQAADEAESALAEASRREGDLADAIIAARRGAYTWDAIAEAASRTPRACQNLARQREGRRR